MHTELLCLHMYRDASVLCGEVHALSLDAIAAATVSGDCRPRRLEKAGSSLPQISDAAQLDQDSAGWSAMWRATVGSVTTFGTRVGGVL